MDEKDNLLQIAILLYPGVTALDAVGPWEVCRAFPIRKYGSSVRKQDRSSPRVMCFCWVLLTQ